MSSRPWRERDLARALAYALLAGDWHPKVMLAAVRRTLGHDHQMFRPLVGELIIRFRRKPADRPHELARLILLMDVFQEAIINAGERGVALRAVDVSAAPTEMASTPTGQPRWPVPRINDVRDLAHWLGLSIGQLLWAADPTGRQLRTGPGALHLYKYHWTARAGRVPRLLEAPTPLLQRVQRQLLDELLSVIPVHDAAHGFVRGRSVITNAARHVGRDWVINIDLRNFFVRIEAARLYGIFRMAGYAEPVAHLLTGLVTTRTPHWPLRQMPAGGSSHDRFRLRSELPRNHLPQGAPTSPALANLACFHLDARLAGYARAAGATYTRYADDLTFSGGPEIGAAAVHLLAGVTRIVTDEGFEVNPAKSRVQGRAGSQRVTGLVVNDRVNVDRDGYDQLRAVLHEARTRGPELANRNGEPDFRAHLHGRIGWVESVNPQRGRRLRRDFDAIAWPPTTHLLR